ncbi:MAG: Dabb family protein [Spirochaetales bacterium]|nr:Dabb family protein [Spirochaetales bacterium]
MIKHVVIWKLKEIEDGPKLKKEIDSLNGQIPGLISIETGLDLNRSSAAGDLILISIHESKDALDLYQDHPLHVKVRDKIVEAVTSRIVVDFEV